MTLNRITLAQLSWSNEGVPISEQFDDVYFSTDDGLAEVEHNFIVRNQLAQRFSALEPSQDFRIAETGFGSGLNFLRAAELWLNETSDDSALHFISFEKYPMCVEDLKRAHQTLPADRDLLIQLSLQLQENYPLLISGWHDLYLAEGKVRLTLWLGDLLKGLPEMDASSGSQIDAWFLDGFAPIKNPDMWQPTLYQQMARLTKPEGSFATFTAAGDVRRGLQRAGFEVVKAQGFGRKREMCFGRKHQQRPHSLKAPWYKRPESLLKGRAGHAVVVGAGLAGAAVAHKLAINGWQVTVLESEADIATQASGNLAGTVHPLLTADWNLRSRWYLQGFEATLRQVLPLLSADTEMGDLSGLIELEMTEKDQLRNQQAIERNALPKALVQPLSAEKNTEFLGASVSQSGVFFPQGGWLYPRSVIKACLNHPNIQLCLNRQVSDIVQAIQTQEGPAQEESSQWSVKTLEKTFQVDAVVVATGSLNKTLNQRLGLPIRPVKGQVTHLMSQQQNNPLKKAVTHSGYSVSHSCGAVTGATFEAPGMTESLSEQSHRENIDNTFQALPDWLHDDIKPSSVTGRVAFRPTTPDHLPIVGPVADPKWLAEAYLSESHTHAVYRYPEQRYQQGLFVSNGHGPRGLMSVFLAAEIIYADLAGQAPVQPLSLYHASHPARFTIRNWRSGKVKTG